MPFVAKMQQLPTNTTLATIHQLSIHLNPRPLARAEPTTNPQRHPPNPPTGYLRVVPLWITLQLDDNRISLTSHPRMTSM
jgi:hypothetical protein